MKKTALTLVTLSSLCTLLAGAVQAADFPGHPAGPGRGGPAMVKPAPVDTDSNGKISLEEFISAAVLRANTLFTLHDTNNDGLLSQDELAPPHAADTGTRPSRPQGPPPGKHGNGKPPVCATQTAATATPPQPEDRFASADTNADGKLSLAEVTAAATAEAKADFAHLDADGDGFLTSADRPAPGSERGKPERTPPACPQA